jgi:hypothetical protein
MECHFSLLANGLLLGRVAAVRQVAALHTMAARLLQQNPETIQFASLADETESHQSSTFMMGDYPSNPLGDRDCIQSDIDGFHDDAVSCKLN